MPPSGLYVKLDANFDLDEKIEAVGLDGAGLFALSLAIAKRALSDGRLTRYKLRRLGATDDLIDRCIAVGLYREDGDAVWIDDWLAHNPSAADIDEKRARDAARKRVTRAKRPRGQDADPRTYTETETETEPSGGVPTTSQSDPVPDPTPEPRSKGGDADGRRARAFAAVGIVADEQVTAARNRGVTIKSEDGFRANALDQVSRRHGSRAHELAHQHPEWTAEQIAAHLRAPASPADDSVSPSAIYAHADRMRAAQDAESAEKGPADPEHAQACFDAMRANLAGFGAKVQARPVLKAVQ